MESILSDLRFDWHTPIDAPFLAEMMARLLYEANIDRSTRGLTPADANARAVEEEKIARLMLTSLYNAHHTLPNSTKVALPLTAAKYSGTDPQKISFSYRSVKQLYDALHKLDWISIKPGVENEGYTRMWSVGELAESFDHVGLQWQKQQPHNRADLIVLRDRCPDATRKSKKKITLPTPQTRQVEEHADNLFQINSFLTKHCIALDLKDEQLQKITEGMRSEQTLEGDSIGSDSEDSQELAAKDSIDLARIQLRRIFSRGDMEKGGRFYGGWWQSLPSLYRPHITIDGYKTCEVDYSAVALRIIYAEEGHPYPVDQDPYDVGLSEWEGANDPRRKHIKTFVNAMLNDESGRYRLPKEEQESIGITHDELAEAVSKQHASISHLFGTGIGLRAQYIDSQLAERLMLYLMHEEIVVLPIHDSFIVRAGYEQWLRTAMVTVFEELTGGKATVTADGSRLPEHFGLTKKDFDSLPTEPEHNIVRGSDTWALIVNRRRNNKIMDQYVGSWKEWQSSQ